MTNYCSEQAAWEKVDELTRAYELKVDDLRRETLRCSALQKQLDSERQAVKELWQIVDEFRAAAITASIKQRRGR